MVVDVLRRLIGRSHSWDAAANYADPTAGVGVGYESYGESNVNYDDIIASLEVMRSELDNIKTLVFNEIKETYDSMVNAIKNGDKETAELLAAEVAIKKNIAKALALVTKLISVAAARVRTARTAEEAARRLGPVVAILRSMSPYLSNVSPEIALQVSAIRDEIERLYSMPGIEVPTIDTKSITEYIPEAKSILRQAAREVSDELDSNLPEPEAPHEAEHVEASIDVEALEARLIEYIRANGGRLNVRRAAEHLGVSPKLIRYILSRLEEKGIIRLAPAGRSAEAI